MERTLKFHDNDIISSKLFSVSVNCPSFQKRFKDGKILYMVRDPLSVIPSGLSLVTGVLDKSFGFWSLPESERQHFIDRLYNALKELMLRFHDDWISDRIDKERVMIVRFDRMMLDFNSLMSEIINFVGPIKDFLEEIKKTDKNQKKFKSGHKYNLKKLEFQNRK